MTGSFVYRARVLPDNWEAASKLEFVCSQNGGGCGAVRRAIRCTDHVLSFPALPDRFAHHHPLPKRLVVPDEMFLVNGFFILSIATASCAVTCGYSDGDPQKPRTAQPGYDCRVDTANGLWGFCPTTVKIATDCGLAGVCVDSRSCTEGCGRLTDRPDITTFSWSVIP